MKDYHFSTKSVLQRKVRQPTKNVGGKLFLADDQHFISMNVNKTHEDNYIKLS